MLNFSKLFESFYGNLIPAHIWMGVSVENAETTWRINDLRKVKCHTRFISFEPLLGPVGNLDLSDIDWAIIGGESGPYFRPAQKEWILDIIKECKKQKVAVFFKQWGGFRPKSGGRTINGKTYSQYPNITTLPNVLKEIEFDEKEFALFCKRTMRQKQLLSV
jgi:protein gp37